MRGACLALVAVLLFGMSMLADEDISQSRVVIRNGDWKLIGDLTLPPGPTAHPVVLMLNKAAGDRVVYRALAGQLAKRGIASLALDLRGHGESTNLGTFIPGENADRDLIWESQVDVIAALGWLREQPKIDGQRMAVVGASYSGEEAAEAGRLEGFEKAYVELSPGSFTEESIDAIDGSGADWLLVVSRDERYLKEITEETRKRSHLVELWELPGTSHATDLFEAHPDLAARIAVWLAERIARPDLESP